MTLKEVIAELQQRGLSVQENAIRWAIRTQQIPRPRMDASLRYDYTTGDVEAIATYLRNRRAARQSVCV